METEKDHELWKTAKKRVGFRRHLGTYIIVNVMFWALWFLTDDGEHESFPWPVWPMFGWGIGLVFNYLDAYVHPKGDAVEKEYEKLKNK